MCETWEKNVKMEQFYALLFATNPNGLTPVESIPLISKFNSRPRYLCGLELKFYDIGFTTPPLVQYLAPNNYFSKTFFNITGHNQAESIVNLLLTKDGLKATTILFPNGDEGFDGNLQAEGNKGFTEFLNHQDNIIGLGANASFLDNLEDVMLFPLSTFISGSIPRIYINFQGHNYYQTYTNSYIGCIISGRIWYHVGGVEIHG